LSEAARNDFFDDSDCYLKRIKELEGKLLTPDKRDHILSVLGVGKHSAMYKRAKAELDEMIP
jgi:hypothetical protein